MKYIEYTGKKESKLCCMGKTKVVYEQVVRNPKMMMCSVCRKQE